MPVKRIRILAAGLVAVTIAAVSAQFTFMSASAQETGKSVSPEEAKLYQLLEQIVQKQAGSWNSGDIDAFMDAYWKSEQLTFCSGGNVRRGWTATRDGYKKKYPTPKEMGQLTFSQLEVQSLGDAAALMLGRWHLDGLDAEAAPEGNFSLVWQKLDGRWVIIHDHTSLQQ